VWRGAVLCCAVQVTVSSMKEAQELLRRAAKARQSSGTNANERSSRSHAVITVRGPAGCVCAVCVDTLVAAEHVKFARQSIPTTYLCPLAQHSPALATKQTTVCSCGVQVKVRPAAAAACAGALVTPAAAAAGAAAPATGGLLTHLQQRHTQQQGQRQSQLCFVDLAGCERVKRTGNSGACLR
jgi:hypothetical protein